MVPCKVSALNQATVSTHVLDETLQPGPHVDEYACLGMICWPAQVHTQGHARLCGRDNNSSASYAACSKSSRATEYHNMMLTVCFDLIMRRRAQCQFDAADLPLPFNSKQQNAL
jgi:hypothetical protein